MIEVLQEALHRPGRGIAKCTNGMALDFIRHVDQLAEIMADLIPDSPEWPGSLPSS